MTDRKEVERLAAKVGAKVIIGDNGMLDSVKWKGREWDPLTFAEKVRSVAFQNGSDKAVVDIQNKIEGTCFENKSPQFLEGYEAGFTGKQGRNDNPYSEARGNFTAPLSHKQDWLTGWIYGNNDRLSNKERRFNK